MKYFPSFERRAVSNDFENGYATDAQPSTIENEEDQQPQLLEKKHWADKQTKKIEEGKKKDSDKKTDGDTKKAKEKKQLTPEERQLKRTELVEQSRYYKYLYERVPIPRDPVVIARLLVAEHILALHKEIEAPKETEKNTNRIELLTAFDRMGELAEKLENPEADTTPEIDEACATILLLAESALDDDQPVERILEVNRETIREEKNENTLREPDIRNSLSSMPILSSSTLSSPAPVVALIDAVMYVRRRAITRGEPLLSSHDGPSRADHLTLSIRSEQPSLIVPKRPGVSLPVRVIEHGEGLGSERITQSTLLQPRKIGSIVLAVALGAVHETRSYDHQEYVHERRTLHRDDDLHHAIMFDRSDSGSDRSSAKLAHAEPMPVPVYEHERSTVADTSISPSTLVETGPSSRKLEHMSLLSLLTMAESVSVGHGQYLKRAFEKGWIDREGLIKVLKSRAKNYDYTREFHRQVAIRRNLVQTSPEFLHSASTYDGSDSGEQAVRQPDVPLPIAEKQEVRKISHSPDTHQQGTVKSRITQRTQVLGSHLPWLSVVVVGGTLFLLALLLIYLFT